MDKQILSLCEILIHEEEDFLVPVKKLYKLVKQEKTEFDLSYEDFLKNLRKNKDFNIIEAIAQEIPSDLCSLEYTESLEECGYFQGPLVHMSYDQISYKEYLDVLKNKITELKLVLQNIYTQKAMNNEVEQSKVPRILEMIDRCDKILDEIERMRGLKY